MASENQNSKKEEKVVSKDVFNSREDYSNLVYHIRILYSLCLFLACGLCASIWLGYTEIQQVKRDFSTELELSSRRYVEFNPELKQHTDSSSPVNFSVYPPNKPDKTQESYDDDDDSLGDSAEKEQLLRVKRRARRHGHGRTDEEERPIYLHEKEGSGVPDDWVWLTSYSRIPVFALQEFCAATQHHCPPGPQGLQGPPGDKGDMGEKGEHGKRGHVGAPGIPGLSGEKGDKGDIGEMGFNGTDGIIGGRNYKRELEDLEALAICGECPAGPPGRAGLPGMPGMKGVPGEPGINGTKGDRGKRGRKGEKGPQGFQGQRGQKGDIGPIGDFGPKGDKGDMGEIPTDFNCTCQKGAKGEKGLRGLIGFIGYKGEPGPQGPPGPPGAYTDGQPGPPGPRGQPGTRGPKGDRGEPGPYSSRYVLGSNLILETSRAPETTTLPSTLAPTTIRRSTTEEPTLPPRTEDCKIRMVGKPMFKRYTGTYWGTWMKDPEPRRDEDESKYWYSRHFTGKMISEYNSADNFRRDHVDTMIELPELYFGTGHVVYQGYLFYHRAGYSEIVKFDLSTNRVEGKARMPDANYQGKNYVYRTEYNYFDLAVDENGLWAIYGSALSRTSLLVSKINHETMEIEKTFNITVNRLSYGNGFVSCGILYLVKDTQRKSTYIDFAYDLYEEKELSLRLKFSNPYQMNNMISYNPKDKEIYCWDKGNQLSYPLLT